MTVVHLGYGVLRGLAADTKPTTYPSGSSFFETDTGIDYYWNGTTWWPTSCALSISKKVGHFPAASGSQFTGSWTGIFSATPLSGSGTAGGQVTDSAGVRIRWSTGATINSLSGVRANTVTAGQTSRQLHPTTEWSAQLPLTATSLRCGIGYISGTTAPVSAADPLANLSGVLFWLDTGVDANWHIMQNDGSATSDNTTIANVVAADGNKHTFGLRANGSIFEYQYAGGAWTTINTKIPAAATALGWIWWVENLTAANRAIEVYGARMYQDG